MKLLRPLLQLGAALLTAGMLSAPAFADEAALPVLDPDALCSLTVSLAGGSGEQTEVNAGITVYHAADIVMTDTGFTFSYVGDFADCTYNLSNYLSPELADSLAWYANKNSIAGISERTDRTGIAVFEGLPVGLYLVTERSAPEGFEPFAPFMTVLPVTEENALNYDVFAAPKTENLAYQSVSVQKIWNDDKDLHTEIIVDLLRNGEPYRQVTLSEENDWFYVWNRLSTEDQWSVLEVNIPAGYRVSYEENSYGFIIRNTPALVQTGQRKWPIPVLGGSGVLLIVLGAAVLAGGRRKRDRNA